MTNFRIILILLYGIAFWQIAATTHTNVHANVEHRIFEPGKLQIIVTRRSSDYHAILIQRATPQKHIDIITVYGKEKVIPNESKAQFFDGHLKGCFQCKAIVVWFADVDIIYGIFNFIHDKLYVEPTSIYDNQYKFNRVPQTPKLPSSLRGLKPFNKTLCPMSMYVDNELNQKFHYDFLAVYRYIMVTVEFVNDIYKSIDFGRTKNGERITGVHFGVVRLTIEKYEYDYGDNEGYVNVNRLLYSFAKVVTSSDVCITVIITGREPLGPNIGAAFGGKIKNSKVYGICGVRQLYDTYTNVAAISTVFNDTVVRVFDLHRTLGHEIGHLASALHDDENLDFATLMAPHVTNGDNESHFTFLDQTIKRMGELLSVVYELCFLWPGHVTECGNGILELGEQHVYSKVMRSALQNITIAAWKIVVLLHQQRHAPFNQMIRK
uniref:Peptidase M12B domain-containing protein n=1 Tax=Panagrellus redivivus TaxID=6233 RepID=A0A7E4VZ31_PANRE